MKWGVFVLLGLGLVGCSEDNSRSVAGPAVGIHCAAEQAKYAALGVGDTKISTVCPPQPPE